MAKAESKDEGKGAGRQGGEASVKDESDMTEGSGVEGDKRWKQESSEMAREVD
jgi:hypothetical protein